MKYAIISDIHANLQALESVLSDAKRNHAEKIVCLGDIVGYGPLPKETLALVRTSAETVIAGNHDDAVSGRISVENFIDLAADAVSRHREALSENDLAWLKSLPYTARLEGAIAAHGDFTDPPAFNYMMDGDTVSANLRATDAQLMFVGHTHVPCVYLVGHSGRLYRIDPEDFTLEDHKRYVVNPGSVGYPRESDGQCYSSYVLYDSVQHTVQYRLLPFSVASVLQRGRSGRPGKKRTIAAVSAVAAAALLSGLAALRLGPVVEKTVEKETVVEKTVEKETVVEKTVYDDDPALIVAKRSLTLPKGAKSVRAGYRIDRGTDLADLRIVFRSADGTVLQELKSTPKGSANQPVKIPDGAVSAEFAVRRLTRDGDPKIKAFDPRWE